MSRFEEDYAKFLRQQMEQATGMRLEMLKKHGAGEKKLLETLWTIFKSFEGFVLEFEIVTTTGVRNFIDAVYIPLRIAFEAEGFVPHAEKATRERFDSERNKVRSTGISGYLYFPFSWDDMDKRPELCRRSVYELLGQLGMHVSEDDTLTLYEREIIRRGILNPQQITFSKMRDWLQMSPSFTRSVIRGLIAKRLLRPENPDAERRHRYVLEEDAYRRLR